MLLEKIVGSTLSILFRFPFSLFTPHISRAQVHSFICLFLWVRQGFVYTNIELLFNSFIYMKGILKYLFFIINWFSFKVMGRLFIFLFYCFFFSYCP